MKYTLLPGTDITISRLSFGTASLHHLESSCKRQNLLAAAVEHGFSHIDTAPYYGFGLSEIEVGRFLKNRSTHISVATKVGLYPPGGGSSTTASVWARKAVGKLVPSLTRPIIDWSIVTASKSLESSLRLLKRDVVDILFLHEPAIGLLNTEEFLDWFIKQRELGKVRYWGLAGPCEKFRSWISDGHPLAQILQVRDSLGDCKNHPVLDAGRDFQLTYGYLSEAKSKSQDLSACDVLRAALAKNRTGSVLVSTRRISHIPTLVSAMESF
jgi:aryl-alcohol dehydrogenase-like predicted oxidoreductase